VQKSEDYIFFRTTGGLILDALPKGSKSNQGYSIDNLLPALNHVRTRNVRHKVTPTLMVHMDNSMTHNGTRITEKMSLKALRRAPHSAYSPDICPCDFWAFGTSKGMRKDQHVQSPEEILRAIQEPWSDCTFEEFQNVLKSCMERLTWMIANNRE
jgi:hypothetical protein